MLIIENMTKRELVGKKELLLCLDKYSDIIIRLEYINYLYFIINSYLFNVTY
jgi:hypothetical protein